MNIRGFFALQIHLKYFFHKDTNRLVVGIVFFKKCLFKKTIHLNKKSEKSKKPNKSKKQPIKYGEYLKENHKKISKILKIEYLFIGSNTGIEDSALTALFTGVLYGICGSVISVLSNFLEINNVNIEIKPVYNKFYFDFKAECILKIKKVNAIKEIFKFIVWMIKKKMEAKKNERTSYMQSYDHGYAKH